MRTISLLILNRREIQSALLNLMTVLFFLLMSSFVYASQSANKIFLTKPKEISGKVSDDANKTLAGVNVTLKGTLTSVMTNENGIFYINVPDNNAILVFSHVGYVTSEVHVKDQDFINVTLTSDSKILGAVVVTGYSSQAIRDITGAVAIVDVKALTSVPNASFTQQLQGRVAGVTVTTDAAPGGDAIVRIRGIGSITGSSDPLYVIDGVPTEGGLRQFNPADIESMQILKDASSASIYGSRASNGVVIITTKRGRGKPQVSLDAYISTQRPQYNTYPKFVDPLTQAGMIWQNYKNINGGTTQGISDAVFGSGPQPEWTGDYMINPTVNPTVVKEGDPRADPSNYSIDPSDPNFGDTKYIIVKLNKQGTNWYNEVFKPALLQNYNLTVSGSSDKSRFAISTGYFDQQGIMLYTHFTRYSLRANSEFNVGSAVRIGENLQFSYALDNLPDRNGGVFSTIGRIFYSQPIAPVYDIGGNFTGTPNNYYWYHNPVAEQYYNKDNGNKESRTFGNVYAEADLLKGLTARTSLGLDYSTGYNSHFSQKIIQELEESGDASLSVNNSYAINLVWTNTLNYIKTFTKKHRISIVGGTEGIKNTSRYDAVSKSGFASNDLSYRYLSAGTILNSASGSGNESRLFSFFGKVDYSYDDKYLASATLRRDASSRFSSANRWGTFPAFSIGWRISKENFMQQVSFINDLKLSASWGKTGNQDIGDYNQYSTYSGSLGSTGYDINGTGNSLATGYTRSLVGNPQAQWEAQAMTNLGLDATMLNNKVELTVQVYDRKSSKLLLYVPHPAVDGQKTFPAENVGNVTNQGIDAMLSYNNRASENQFNYGVSINWSTFSNKVTELYSGNDAFIEGIHLNGNGYDFGSFNRTVIGQPIASFYTLVKTGTFQTQAEADKAPVQFGNAALYNQPGRWKFKDVNGDGVIDDKDRQFTGNPTPKFTYGINLTAAWKGFDVAVFFQGVQGNKVANYMKFWTDFVPGSISYAASVKALDSWTASNPNAKMPELNSNAENGPETGPSNFYLEDGSYFRCKNVQLGYSFSPSSLAKIHISKIRLYVTGTNLFTITKYTGIDPEVIPASGNLLSLGVDQGIYPFSKTYSVGLQVGF